MSEKKIFVLTGENGFLGQGLHPWDSLNVDKIKRIFQEHKCDVKHVTFCQVVNGEIDISDSIIVYSSSQRDFYKHYIEDVVTYLYQKNNLLIPSLNTLKSHENKGYQEPHKALCGIKSLKTLYLTSEELFDECKELAHFKYPVVLKYTEGAGSWEVHLVHNQKELFRLANRFRNFSTYRLKRFIKEKIKKYVMPSRYDQERERYYKNKNRFVLQEYVPNLKYDYKVLVFGEKYYVLKRYVRKNDFKASGSGMFVFEKVEPGLLDYSERIFKSFKEPMLSMDICFDGINYHLLEFQGTHFGPYTLNASKGFYRKEHDSWKFIEQNSDLDEEFALSVVKYIREKI